MSYGDSDTGLLDPRTVKHRIFVSFHHGGDQAYYQAFSTAFDDVYDVIYDNSLERQIDSNDVDYVMRQIRERYIAGSSCSIVLVGKETAGRRYVDWEIQATLDKAHGLIGVYLPTAPRSHDNKIIVPRRLHGNIQSGFALWLSWQQITTSAKELQQYVALAKARDTLLIVNPRDRLLHNS